MSREIDNRTREVPQESHWDKSGRASFLRATYPYPGCERLARGIEDNNGYIRGGEAEVLYRALKPYLDRRSAERTVGVEAGTLVGNGGING
ncbi:MAG: hypothetical protein AAB512_03600 [Patescibacteria group bacterium]